MSIVVRIAVGGSLDGATVPPSVPAAVKQGDGSYLITIPGSLGVLALQDLLDAIPGAQAEDVFFPRVEWTPYSGTNTLNMLGPGLAAPGPDRTLTNGSAGPVFVPELGGLRFFSSAAGPFQIDMDLVPLYSQQAIIEAACCSAEQDSGGGGGGGGGNIEVQDEGATVVASATALNFTGAGVVASDAGGGVAQIDIPGGSLPPLQSATFLDNGVQDLTIAPDTDGFVAVEMNLSKAAGGESSSYRFDIATGNAPNVDYSLLEIDSPTPITGIAISVLLVAGNIVIRLTGSGAGVNTTANYRVVDNIARAF